MTVVDWSRLQKCQQCGALLGEPCVEFSGFANCTVMVAADRPHSGRKLRAAAARDAQFGRVIGR